MKGNKEYGDLACFRTESTNRGKVYFLDVKKNEHGKFLKITESRPSANGYIRNVVMVPEDALVGFRESFGKALRYMKKLKGGKEND